MDVYAAAERAGLSWAHEIVDALDRLIDKCLGQERQQPAGIGFVGMRAHGSLRRSVHGCAPFSEPEKPSIGACSSVPLNGGDLSKFFRRRLLEALEHVSEALFASFRGGAYEAAR